MAQKDEEGDCHDHDGRCEKDEPKIAELRIGAAIVSRRLAEKKNRAHEDGDKEEAHDGDDEAVAREPPQLPQQNRIHLVRQNHAHCLSLGQLG